MRARLIVLCLWALFVFGGSSLAYGCEQSLPHPVISVVASESPAKIDLSRSVAQLSQVDIDTKSPYPSHYHADIGGLMNGEITVEHRVRYNSLIKGDAGCVYVEKIDVKVKLDPTIYIAKEFEKDACLFKEILKHEQKHVSADRYIVGRFKGKAADSLNMSMIKADDYSSDWVSSDELDHEQKLLQLGIEHNLQNLFNTLLRERGEKQQAIDSLEEYERISSVCNAA